MSFRLSILLSATCMTALAASAERVRIVSETGDTNTLASVAAELNDETQAETIFEARRQAKSAAERAEAYLNSRGYFAAEISYAVEAGPPITPQIKIEPGLRFSIGHIKLSVVGRQTSAEIQSALDSVLELEPGSVGLPSKIIAQEAGLLAALKKIGHGEAAALERRITGDRDAGTLDIEYRLNPGPRLRFGNVIFAESVRTRRDYLNRLIPFERGALYSSDLLTEFNRRLGANRTYSVSSAQLKSEPTEILENGDEIRDVIVTLIERPRYTLATGASFSTSEGPGVTASLTRRNATRRGDTITGSLTLAEQQSALGVDWRIPNFTAYARSLNLSGLVEQEQTDAFDRDAITFAGTYEIKYTPRLTTAFGAASEFTREEDALGQRDLQILSASAAARLDHSDDPLDPSKGWRADLRTEPALVVGDRQSQFLTLDGQLSAYRPTFEGRLILAGRARSGFVYGANIEDLPVSRRFFAGGGGSARGFAFQSVGPKDTDDNPIGGRSLVEFSGELRWRGNGNLGYVGFVDGAAVSSAEAARFSDLRYSAGFGLRYKTVVGPIRFDIATPLDKQDGDDPVQIYVSLGQAF